MAQNISGIAPYDFPLFFFDANVWIAILKNTKSITVKAYETPYITFLEGIISTHGITDEKALKRIKFPKPKIVLTSVLLSEIINTYTRNVAMKAYCYFYKIKMNDCDFKKDYRPKDDYQIQLKKLVDDITAFSDYCVVMDDGFTALKPFEMMKEMSNKYDFNDYFYYHFCKKHDIPVVTHDKDFKFNDIQVFTNNKSLLT